MTALVELIEVDELPVGLLGPPSSSVHGRSRPEITSPPGRERVTARRPYLLMPWLEI
jgi:hypothetical protein